MRTPLVVSLALVAAGCAPGQVGEDGAEDSAADELKHSIEANLEHPEVGRLVLYHPDAPSTAGRCTGTLIGRRTIITAAHCFEFQSQIADSDLGRFVIQPADGSGRRYSGFRRAVVGGDNDFDIAVVQLESIVSPQLATPAEIDTRNPGVLDTMTIYGYGSYGADCSQNDDIKRRWSLSAAAPVHLAVSCPGDSGGPYLSERSGKIVALVKGWWTFFERSAQPIAHRDWIMDRLAESEAGRLGE